ncbi:MAG: adenylyl-sulfate kinase [Bacteroidales bacterium]|nr:adenylyl-sulfate kinase [Bacteroidales bacterium]
MIYNTIFPERERFIERLQKEQILKQRGIVIWFTGLSGSGKSTLAQELEKKFHSKDLLTVVLDGDKIRKGLNANLGFSYSDRIENIRRVAEVSKLFFCTGIITIAACITPTREMQNTVRQIIGDDDLFEIYLNTPIDICEKRDVKGLYKKARNGQVKNFTGISSIYEIPKNPDIILNTANQSIEECSCLIFNRIINKIGLSEV